MRNDPVVIDLVTRARNGERAAWDALVERYSPLVWSICYRWRLDRTDAEDVGQAVWLRLLEQLDNLRDPAALPGWLVTTTKRECYRVQDAASRSAFGDSVLDVEDLPDKQSATAEDELLEAERHTALREALADLPPNCQQLLLLLIADPPVPYAEISSRLGIAVGSIGPYRSRILDRLRRHPAIAALIDAETTGSPRGLSSVAARRCGVLAATVFAHESAAFGIHVLAGAGGDVRRVAGLGWVRAREPQITAGRRVRIDRKRARPYDGHGRHRPGIPSRGRRNMGVPSPEGVPPAVATTGTTPPLLPRADGTLRSSPGTQGSAVQKQEEIDKCRRR